MPFLVISIVLLLALFVGRKKSATPKRAVQKQDEELISVILPTTINHDK